jgi:hypothetical protein
MVGPNPISFESIRAWGELFGHEFSIWEVDAIRSLDAAWMMAISETSNHGNRRKPSTRR